MAIIFIDNKPYEIKDGQNLLSACLNLGFNLPYFCWHPAMHSVGACRQCAVKQFQDEKDTRGRIIMSCMTPATDGIRISIDDPDAVKFRRSAIEWVMLNHPHDCPVCDEGGECHLQDMTVMTGHVYRRSRFRKRTFHNQNLGPFINHEMNRCIHCYRCIRFYRDYAGGRDFNVFGSRDHVYFGRHKDGTLESEFSGNLTEICPTGVFTDKTMKKHYTRKWDMQTAPSVCVHCGLGCNTLPGERYGTLRRVINRYNGEINGYFICDRGRFGYEFANSDRRIMPLSAVGKKGQTVNSENQKKITKEMLSNLLYFGAGVIGIGSPRATVEANFALRTLVGTDSFYTGLSEEDSSLISLIIDILRKGSARTPSLHEVEMSDAVLVLGEDVTNTAPMLDLSLRQSVRQKPMRACDGLGVPRWHAHAMRDIIQNETGPLFIASPARTKLDSIATETYRAAPDDIARLGFAVARAIDDEAPEVTDIPSEIQILAKKIARAMGEADRPLIISGVGCRREAVIQAAANVAWALRRKARAASLCFAVPECNTLGLGLIGGNSLDSAVRDAEDGRANTLVILENDLYRRAEKKKIDKLFEKIRNVVVIDCLKSATTSKATILLPSGTYAETDGTLVNSEGRAQRFFKVIPPADGIQESWRWILDMMSIAERPETHKWKLFEDITKAAAESLPLFEAITEIAPSSSFRIAGMKIPRQSHRYSGRTSMQAHVSVHESKPQDDPDSPLAFSMEGYEGIPPSSLIPRFWSPGWNSVQAVNKYQSEIGGPLLGGDPGRRLIEPGQENALPYFSQVPAAFRPDPEKLLLIPLFHIFGSEELSILAPGIAELAPEPYLGLRRDKMQKMEIQEGEKAELAIDESVLHLTVKCIPTLPAGVAGLPSGLPGLAGVCLPVWGRVSKLKKEEGLP